MPIGHYISDFSVELYQAYELLHIFFYVLQQLTPSIFHRAVNIKAEDTCLVRQLTVSSSIQCPQSNYSAGRKEKSSCIAFPLILYK